RAVRRLRLQHWRAQLKVAEDAIRNGDETVTVEPRPDVDDVEEEKVDDPWGRAVADLAWHGVRGPQYQQHLAQVAAEEAQRWSHLMPGARLRNALITVTGQSWVNIGPADARFEFNSKQYTANDSGRPNAIRVDPR